MALERRKKGALMSLSVNGTEWSCTEDGCERRQGAPLRRVGDLSAGCRLSGDTRVSGFLCRPAERGAGYVFAALAEGGPKPEAVGRPRPGPPFGKMSPLTDDRNHQCFRWVLSPRRSLIR